MLTTLPGGEYLLPASLQPAFLVILDGEISLHHEGRTEKMASFSLCGSTRGPRHATATHGCRIFTLSVRVGRLPCLVDLSAVSLIDHWVSLGELLKGDERGVWECCTARLATPQITVSERVDAVLRFLSSLRSRRAVIRPDLFVAPELFRHSPRILAAQYGLSLRQFERRFLSSYGQSLRAFNRQKRCSQFLAAFLDTADQSSEKWAEQALSGGYYDQSHFYHDIRHFTGYTPAQLKAGIGSDDPAFWPYRITSETLHRLFGPVGY